MKSQLNNIRMGGLCALVAVLTLGSSGCLALVAGTAGGVAAYAYVKGKVDESYTASFGDTWAATHAAMRDLGMPVLKEENTTTKGAIESKNAEGEKVHIQVEAKSGNKPADGTTTRVDVRVATFGDRRYSDHFLNQIGVHLAPAGAGNPAARPGAVLQAPVAGGGPAGIIQTQAPALAPNSQTPATSGVQQSSQPPLLPDAAIPAKK